MSHTEKIVFVFPSVHHSMEGEDLFDKAGLNPDYIQIPAHLGLGCGTGVIVDKSHLDEAIAILRKNRVPYRGIFIFTDGAWSKVHPKNSNSQKG